MLKRLVSFMLLLSVFNTYAVEASGTNLKEAFDSLNYSLSVEWDQKDKSFKTQKVQEFNAKVAELQAKGLTSSDLVDFAKSQVEDKNLKASMDRIFATVNINKLSAKEARKLVLDEINSSYEQGANWSGTGSVLITALVLVLVIAAVASGSSVGVAVGGCYDYYTECGYETYCDFYGCYDEYVCYDYCY